MNLEISTPALLFPAITLLLLAYTNRFLAVATLIRSLYKRYEESGHALDPEFESKVNWIKKSPS